MIDLRPARVESRAERDPQPGNPALCRLRQRVIGERHVGEFRIAALALLGWRHLDRIEQRQRRRRRPVRFVGVPMVIGRRRTSDRRVAVSVEVREHVRDVPPLCLAAIAAMRLDRAEIGLERELLLAGQRLPRKRDEMIGEEGDADRLDDDRRTTAGKDHAPRC